MLRVECGCSYSNKETFPNTVKAPVQYGQNLCSLVCYLRPPVCLLGKAHRVDRQHHQRVDEPRYRFQHARACCPFFAPVVRGYKGFGGHFPRGGDETELRVNGRKRWGWTWQTAGETYIACSKICGYDTVMEHFPEGFPGTEIFAIIRSVVDTLFKKGSNPLPMLAFALNVAAHKNDFMTGHT